MHWVRNALAIHSKGLGMDAGNESEDADARKHYATVCGLIEMDQVKCVDVGWGRKVVVDLLLWMKRWKKEWVVGGGRVLVRGWRGCFVVNRN